MPHGPELEPGEAFSVGCAFALVWIVVIVGLVALFAR